MSLFDGNEWRAMAVNSGEAYEAGYADAVRYLNSRLVTIVRNILTRANRPTIFLIQGDHGPGSHFNRESAEETDLHERFAILFAMRFPEGTDQRINSFITPVNGFRLLLNRAIGTQ
jgi:phosphoglycerol transferase MdoB-like AlkP superfamily enzyme